MKTLFSVLLLALVASTAPIAFAQNSLRSVDGRAPQEPDNSRLAAALIQASKAEVWLDEPRQDEIADEHEGVRTIGELEDVINRSLSEHKGIAPTRVRLKVSQRPPMQSGIGIMTEPSVVVTGYRAIVFYPKPLVK